MSNTLAIDTHTLMACYWGCHLHSLGIPLGGHSAVEYLNDSTGLDLTPLQWLEVLRPSYEAMVSPL